MAFEEQRQKMVHEQLAKRGIHDPRVLEAFQRIPRHLFVPEDFVDQAYEDHPIQIGGGQTISQPYIVAVMVHLLKLHGHERVLEIGTGSGYQLAILAQLALDVYSVERLPELGATALRRLEQLGFLNVHISSGNGTLGWPEHAPYDAIVVAAASPEIPQPLVDQLGPGGRLVIPVGSKEQQTLLLAEKRPDQLHVTQITQCMFVPLIGEQGWTGLS